MRRGLFVSCLAANLILVGLIAVGLGLDWTVGWS